MIDNRVHEHLTTQTKAEDEMVFQFVYEHFTCSPNFNDYHIIDYLTRDPFSKILAIVCQTCFGSKDHSFRVLQQDTILSSYHNPI